MRPSEITKKKEFLLDCQQQGMNEEEMRRMAHLYSLCEASHKREEWRREWGDEMAAAIFAARSERVL
jgi:hypothetical protein